MAFSIEATLIVPAIFMIITCSVSFAGRSSETTVKICKDAAVSLTEKHFRRSDKNEIDAVLLIEGTDLIIDLYGNLNDIGEHLQKIYGTMK